MLDASFDADMDKLPTDAVVAIDGTTVSTGDAMADGADAAELFDIEMYELAWAMAFIAPDRFGRLQGTEPVQAEPPLPPSLLARADEVIE
jgi:hypothetical protein